MDNTLTSILISIIIAGGVAVVFCCRKYKEMEKELKRTQKELEKEREELGGFNEFNKKIAEIKNERKQKIMNELGKNGKINTGGVADLLEISKATAFRYLEELEKEGKIKQVGSFGRAVEYRIK